ncbi:dienelactone hydrolase family protein [Frigoribacterium salinisoli]
MTDIVLFHHARGLTAGVRGLAADLEADGHVVHLPDLFHGATFDTIDEGVEHARRTGTDVLLERGVAAGTRAPADSVYVGLSLGALPAQALAQRRVGARGAVLLEGCVPVTEFGDTWPTGVALQVHGAEDDPWFAEDLAAARELVLGADDGELFLYPGDGHLFTDASTDAYDAASTTLVLERVRGLLARVG